jgi:hypothetical protein
MAKTTSRRLVIDADVARSAGGEQATHPRSKHCRDFPRAVLEICHRLVLTPLTGDEWKRHRSRFAATWLGQMYA